MELIDYCNAVQAASPLAELPEVAQRRMIRQNAGISSDLAAALIGISGMTLSHWELGRHTPQPAKSLAYRKFLAAALLLVPLGCAQRSAAEQLRSCA